MEGDEVRFVTNIVRAVTGDYNYAGVAIKHGYYHRQLYFLNAIK